MPVDVVQMPSSSRNHSAGQGQDRGHELQDVVIEGAVQLLGGWGGGCMLGLALLYVRKKAMHRQNSCRHNRMCIDCMIYSTATTTGC